MVDKVKDKAALHNTYIKLYRDALDVKEYNSVDMGVPSFCFELSYSGQHFHASNPPKVRMSAGPKKLKN